jgi:hypothetical protein
MFSRVLISLGSVLLILCVEKISALSTMLVGSVATTPHGGAMYSSGTFGGDNSTVSFDSHDGMTRLHGSGLKVQVDLLEIVTERGTFRTGPTHTEFQQAGGNVPSWAQLYSDDEMTVYYNDQPVLQLAGGSDASLTVNGMGYFADVAIDKKSAKLIGMAICGAKNSISSSSGHACDASAFTTVGQILVAIVQGQLDVTQQLAQTGGSSNSNSNSNSNSKKGGGITDAELGAQMKSALASFEAQLLTGKPLKNTVSQYTEGLAKQHTEHAQKQEDLYMKMQTALGELSRNAATTDGEVNQLRERLHVAEAEGGMKDDIAQLRATIKEIDSGIVKSHADLVASIDKKAGSLASQIAESDIKTYTGLLSVAQQGWYNITVARDDLRNDITTLQKRADTATDANVAVQTELARIDVAVTKAAAEAQAETEKVKSELSGDIDKVGNSMQIRLGTLEASVLASVEAVNTAMTDKLTQAHGASAANAATIAQLAHNTSEITNEISTAVAKSNGILSRVIGEMNTTMVATVAKVGSQAEAHQELLQRVDEGLSASLVNLTGLESALKSEISVAKERQDAAIVSINTTTLDILSLTETRLLHGIEEISREVTAVESSVKGMMAMQGEEMRAQMAAMNTTATQALEEALARVGRELGDMRSTVAAQLSELTSTVTAMSTESAVAREVLSERVSSLTARVDKEETASTVGVETSAQNREKISKIETQLEHCDARHRESADETSKMRERLTKLETLVEVLMKK